MSKQDELKNICFYADLALSAIAKEDDTLINRITGHVYFRMDNLTSHIIWTQGWDLLYRALFSLQDAYLMEKGKNRTRNIAKHENTLKYILKLNEKTSK
jgi:hypothetical protein